MKTSYRNPHVTVNDQKRSPQEQQQVKTVFLIKKN